MSVVYTFRNYPSVYMFGSYTYILLLFLFSVLVAATGCDPNPSDY